MLAAFTINCSLNGQTLKKGTAGELEGMMKRLRENISPEEKLKINDSVKYIIEAYANSDTIFKHRFSNLRFLGQIDSPDSLVKILTWNLILADGANKYFCYIIRRHDISAKAIVYKLTGLYREDPVKTDIIYAQSDWYGALYYDIRPFISGGETCYTLLGIDYGNSFITRKIIDVLTFRQPNTLIFGRKCFTDGKSFQHRVVFEFASTVAMSLRFETGMSIIFDHLSPISPEYKDNHQYYGPDFSFDGYYLENGLWLLKQNIDIRNKQ
jgi:hypothetical protein